VAQIDLIDALVELATAEEPRRSAERTLNVLVRTFRCRAGAVFSADERPKLFVGHAIDEGALESVKQLWPNRRAALKRGEIVRLDAGSLKAGESLPATGVAALLFPILAGEELKGLLYIDGLSPRFGVTMDFKDLAPFLRILSRALSGGGEDRVEGQAPAVVGLRAPSGRIGREDLVLVLEQNDWNIARVSRALDVTRPTIYQWLERLGIPRRRVPVGVRKLATR
jgi:transcriptional regulator with GAF, ATPase, and Fis domain